MISPNLSEPPPESGSGLTMEKLMKAKKELMKAKELMENYKLEVSSPLLVHNSSDGIDFFKKATGITDSQFLDLVKAGKVVLTERLEEH